VPARYDQIGEQYEEYANTATMKLAERSMFLELVGALDGERVLDVACGTGYYTRILKQRGAGRVVGSDISAEMIRLAREAEAERPLGVEYRIADGADLADLAPFDLVTGVWLLNYAGTVTNLQRLVRDVHARLRPGGRFVSITINPDYDLGRSNMTKYGIEVLADDPTGDPPKLVGRFMTDPPSEPVVVDHWSRDVYERAFGEAGFTSLDWEPYRLAGDLLAEHGEPYWHDLLDNGLPIALVART
jgi:SAM-dependent methyltransferase